MNRILEIKGWKDPLLWYVDNDLQSTIDSFSDRIIAILEGLQKRIQLGDSIE